MLTLCKYCCVTCGSFSVRRVVRARCTWDRAQADATKPGTDPSAPASPRLDGALHVTSLVHRSSLWSQHMYVNKYTRSVTPASSMPTSRHRRARARTRAHMAITTISLLETPRQHRPCQHFGTDFPTLAQEPYSHVHTRLCSRRHASHAHANVSARTCPRSYKSHFVITHATLLARARTRAMICLLLLFLICVGIGCGVVRVCVVFVFLSPQSGQDALFHRFPHLATSQLRWQDRVDPRRSHLLQQPEFSSRRLVCGFRVRRNPGYVDGDVKLPNWVPEDRRKISRVLLGAVSFHQATFDGLAVHQQCHVLAPQLFRMHVNCRHSSQELDHGNLSLSRLPLAC